MKPRRVTKQGLLNGARVYLSGPMDFVASRAAEKKFGWRNRVGEFLRYMGATVFDPWNKPEVRGIFEYGREDEETTKIRKKWKFNPNKDAARARAFCAGKFWETLHIDLRMVDTSDLTIAYCPTNIYSVGTPNEIVLARQQRKPVLLVSPSIEFQSLEKLRKHLKKDRRGTALLEQLVNEVPIKESPRGIPSLWYMPLVGSENFFDGFGFSYYRRQFKWKDIPMDKREEEHRPVRSLLPTLDKIHRGEIPKRFRRGRYIRNDDWLIWDLKSVRGGGAQVEDVKK